MENTNQYLLRLEKKSKTMLMTTYIGLSVLLFGILYQFTNLSVKDFRYEIMFVFIQVLIMLLSKRIGKLLLKWEFSIEVSSQMLSLIGLYSGYTLIELDIGSRTESLLLSIFTIIVHLYIVSHLFVYEYKVMKEIKDEFQRG